MSLLYKPDFESSQRYWDAFWAHEIVDRPCTVVFAKRMANAMPAPYVQGIDESISETLDKHEQYLQNHVFLGEAIPGVRPSFGPDQMAGFIGAPIHFSRENNTSWSEKIVTDWRKFGEIKINPQSRCWQRMLQLHQEAQQFCEGKCLIHNIDLHSNIDLLEGLRGAQHLLFDIIDHPELIITAMVQARSLYKEVFDKFNQFGNKAILGNSTLTHLYSRGTHNPIQADFICLLSPEMFREFVLPAIIEEAQFLDHSFFHLDGVDALKHIDDILAIPEIDAIQWIPGAGQKPQLEWPEVLHKIQAAGKAIIIYATIDQIKSIHGEYDSKLLVYQTQAENEAEGIKFLEWLVKNT